MPFTAPEVSRYVAFLQAVNTGGRRVKNVQLSEALRSIGASHAQGFIASGNVIFDIDRPVDDEFIEQIELAFYEAYGFDIPTVVRTAAQVRSVARYRPFTVESIEGSTGKLYVGFLKSRPEPAIIDEVQAKSTSTDRLAVHGREIYWLPMDGENNSDISIPGIARLVGTMTVRVMNTVNRIVERFLTRL